MKALRLSKSSSASLGLSLQVSHGRGSVAWARQTGLVTDHPAQSSNHTPNSSIHAFNISQRHHTHTKNKTVTTHTRNKLERKSLASLTWNELVLRPRHRTAKHHSPRRRLQSCKNEHRVFNTEALTLHTETGPEIEKCGLGVLTWAKTVKLNVRLGTLWNPSRDDNSNSKKSGGSVFTKSEHKLGFGHFRSEIELGQPP